MTGRRRASWWLGGAGLALALALLGAAEPREVVALAAHARWPYLAAAFALTCVLTAVRGLRLRLLAGRELRPLRAAEVAAAAQLANAALPLRLGELAMVPLLQAAGVPGTVRGLSVLVVVRVVDLLALVAWAALAGGLAGGSPAAAVVTLVLLAGILAAGWAAGVRTLRRLALAWRRRPGWRRRSLAQLLRVRRELRRLARSPLRGGAVAALSVAVWGGIWGVTWALVRAIGLDWAPLPLLVGVVGAGVGSSLPVNFVGSFGSQEAGWTAALAGVGVEPRAALAAGFACHLWSLVFTLALGLAGTVGLAARQPGTSPSTLLARVRSLVSSGRDA
ncbi:MAG: lysylphosphatidylglycerol synthase domain-containing protein [Thermoanaerobaculaceae bacterium]|nr:lysylphosphatidylglycerol synthase domain-containing protein [Thermoanaerobaculaceae bacterium]TAM51676.1 MAG: hypothetical protein EPN53_06735 [Acidobacteriota bacterium]